MTRDACEINLNFVQERKHFHNLFTFNNQERWPSCPNIMSKKTGKLYPAIASCDGFKWIHVDWCY